MKTLLLAIVLSFAGPVFALDLGAVDSIPIECSNEGMDISVGVITDDPAGDTVVVAVTGGEGAAQHLASHSRWLRSIQITSSEVLESSEKE